MKNLRSELIERLPESKDADRKELAEKIVEADIDLSQLYDLFLMEKVGMRLAWTLTDVAFDHHNFLAPQLPKLWEFARTVNQFDLYSSFTNYWRYCGVPEEMEGLAVDYCFSILKSKSYNKTIKTRALWVIEGMLPKYPALKQEIEAIQNTENTGNCTSLRLRIDALLDQ